MSNPIERTVMLANKVKTAVRDGWENVFTGLGVEGKDKRTGGRARYRKFAQRELEFLHDSDDIAKKVVNLIPDKGTKRWIEHKIPENEGGKELIKKIVDDEERLQVRKKFKQAWAWGRLYGGAVVYISVEDGLEPHEPLNFNRITKINSLTVLHRHELSRTMIETDIDSPDYGLPKGYTVSGKSSIKAISGTPEIHRSRLLFFHGSPLSQNQFEANDYWHDSVLVVLHDILRDYNAAYSSVAHTVQDFNINILKLKNLAEIIASDEDDLVMSRLKLMNLSKSILGSIVLDAEDEGMENLTTQLTGLKDVLGKLDDRLVIATGMPHTIVLGEGASGTLSGKGESEEKNFNSLIEDEQTEVLEDNLNFFHKIQLAAKQGPTNGRVPKSHSWKFVPLTQPGEKEVVEIKNIQAKTDDIYLKHSVLSANEVATSRFGGDEYSHETSIDLNDRDEQDEAAKIPPADAKKIIEGQE